MVYNSVNRENANFVTQKYGSIGTTRKGEDNNHKKKSK